MRTIHACLFTVVLLLSGCADIPDVPNVEVDGTIHGGHEKLRTLLTSIREISRRPSDSGRFSRIVYAGYLPTGGRAGYIYGGFAGLEGATDVEFTIACDANTIDNAEEAMVTEMLTGKVTGDVELNVLRFHWRGNGWNQASALGIEAGPTGELVRFDVEYVNAHGSTTGEHSIVVYKIRTVSPVLPQAPVYLHVHHVTRLGPELPEKGERFLFEVPRAALHFDDDNKSCLVKNRFLHQVHAILPP
jgi:hypothetical protein